MITLRELSNALALAEHGNFGRAARARKMSQPAFSRSVRNLEDELGVQLFHRSKQGTIPTAFGDALLRRAETILVETEELEREIVLLQGLDAGRLTVAMAENTADLSGTAACGELLMRHPSLHLSALRMSWYAVGDAVLDRRAEVGLAEISTLSREARLQTEFVGGHDVVFYCREGHPLAQRSRVSRQDLARYPLATTRLPPRASNVPFQTEIDPESSHRIPAVEVNDSVVARRIVNASDSIGLHARIEVDSWKSEGICPLPFREPWMRLNYGFIYLRDRSLSPGAKAFMEAVRRIEKRLAEQGRTTVP